MMTCDTETNRCGVGPWEMPRLFPPLSVVWSPRPNVRRGPVTQHFRDLVSPACVWSSMPCPSPVPGRTLPRQRLGPPAWGCSVGSRVYCALSPPRVLAEAPCPRPPPRRLKPGLDGRTLVRVSRSLSRTLCAAPLALLSPGLSGQFCPGWGCFLQNALIWKPEKSCASSGPADKEVDASGDHSGQEDPSHSGNLQEGPGVQMFMGRAPDHRPYALRAQGRDLDSSWMPPVPRGITLQAPLTRPEPRASSLLDLDCLTRWHPGRPAVGSQTPAGGAEDGTTSAFPLGFQNMPQAPLRAH
ncbi:unnamed protein product [Rangifer tarandus platyrhynchus]|uniref:Uncharacterized protein n=2 Tax=Rangifer tarandus platyrhynchus TaxID=3082113 RepID=A0ABN8YHA7_RANTA|nr:unnamed protein product [Rangifer tarandus platyrhynchus]CAI9698772.1 unnamed protein product [Rangifer tarandus platyrhynchus]